MPRRPAPPRNDKIVVHPSAWAASIFKNALARCSKTAPQSICSLPRKHSFTRPGVGLGARVFRRIMEDALAFFGGVDYTVGGNIEKRPFPACGNRRFGSGRFLCRYDIHGIHSFCKFWIWSNAHAPILVSASSFAIRLSRRSSSSILPSLRSRSTARVRCSRSPTISSSVK